MPIQDIKPFKPFLLLKSTEFLHLPQKKHLNSQGVPPQKYYYGQTAKTNPSHLLNSTTEMRYGWIIRIFWIIIK